MTKLNLINRICLAGAFLLAFSAHAPEASALSVEWRNLDARERIIIKLEPSDGRTGAIVRSAAQSVHIPFSSGSKVFVMAAPKSSRLFGGIGEAPGGITLKLKTADFGFVVTRPSKDVLYIDLFADPLGRRWSKGAAQSASAVRQAVSGDTPAANPEVSAKPVAPANQPAPVISPKSGGDNAVLYPPVPGSPSQTSDALFENDPAPVFSGKISPPQDSGSTPKSPLDNDIAPVKVTPPQAVEQDEPVAVKPVDSAKPVEPAKPVIPAKQSDAVKPAEPAKPVEAAKPADSAKPVEAAKPVAPAKAAEQQAAAKPAVQQQSAASQGSPDVPPLGQNIRQAPRLGDPALNPDDEREAYKLPAWPPMEMPASLPKPPPPPPAGVDQMSSHTRGHMPAFAVAGAGHEAAYDSGSAAAFAFFILRNELAVRVFSSRWLPFGAAPAFAAAESAGEYHTVEVPFAYRAKVNKSRDPNWSEQPIPVMLSVPKSVTFADPNAVVPPGAIEAPAVSAPMQTGGGQGAPAPTGTASGGQTAVSPSTGAASQSRPSAGGTLTPAGQATATAPAASAGAAAPAAQSGTTSGSGAVGGSTSVSPSGAGAPGGSTPASPSGTGSAGLAQVPSANAGSAVAPATAASGGASTQVAAAGPSTQARAGASGQAAASAPVQAKPATPEQPQKTVVYVDEAGNPVDAPLNPDTASKDVERHANNGEYDPALAILDKLLKQHDLTQAQRETFLHRKADLVFSKYEKDLAPHYQEIREATTSAVNFNTQSRRNAAAYMRLGYINIIVNNSYEAAAYFNLLRQKFPNYENLPLTYYYWGNYQYEQGNLPEAAEQFNYVVLNYPEHPISRDAALGLTRTYYRMGSYQEAYRIMEFVELRWPSFYLDYPPMLSMLGDVALRAGSVDKARAAYWLYYNLVPDAPDADIILTRLGDIYMSGKFHSAAVQVYTEAMERFPAKDGGIISLMRLAEDGIYDDPSISAMFKVFDRPYDRRPAEAYRTIIREYPQNPLVTLAKLKLSMWNLRQKDYIGALDLCSEIVSDTPNSPLVPRAREVAMSAFTLLAAEDAGDKRYTRAREVWQRYPILRTQEEFLDPESRLALAVSQWNTGFQDEALYTLQPFFYGNKAGEISELAMYLALNILTEHFRWEQIVELAQRIELWELTPPAKAQLDYALGLAYENMDRADSAAPIWASLYESKLLPPTQQANVAFYFARSVERKRDFESAYYVGQDSLRQLQELAAVNPSLADNEKIKSQIMSLIDIAETAGQLQLALDYAGQYMKYTAEGSLDQQSVVYRVARIHKKKGDTADWLANLEELSGKYPDSVYGRMAGAELSSYRLGNEAARFSPGNI